jgi:hypothetical protein
MATSTIDRDVSLKCCYSPLKVGGRQDANVRVDKRPRRPQAHTLRVSTQELPQGFRRLSCSIRQTPEAPVEHLAAMTLYLRAEVRIRHSAASRALRATRAGGGLRICRSAGQGLG